MYYSRKSRRKGLRYMNEEEKKLFFPKISNETEVKVYRAFEGYCGIGRIVKGFPTGLIPYYEIDLIKGHYLGKEAPLKCYVNENMLEVIR